VELGGDDHLIYTGDADRIVDEAQAFFGQHSSVDIHAERTLATVLSVAATKTRRSRDMDALFDQTVASHRGRRVHGDELEATFDGPERAIRCACVLVAAGAQRGHGLKAGIHTGETEIAAGRQTSVPFLMAAALAEAAREREVVVSRTVKDLVSGSRVQFDNRGRRRVAGVDGIWETYAARLPDVDAVDQ
jgi:class 3 adenylate cyclase